jgi:hypothetical protein
MKAICRYIEAHHEAYGVALFILPALALACMTIGIIDGLAWMFR